MYQVIAEHVYSSRFGTFIVNSETEREEVSLMSTIFGTLQAKLCMVDDSSKASLCFVGRC